MLCQTWQCLAGWLERMSTNLISKSLAEKWNLKNNQNIQIYKSNCKQFYLHFPTNVLLNSQYYYILCIFGHGT